MMKIKTKRRIKMKAAVIYARYSSFGQTEQSIEGQVRECTEYAKQNDIVIVGSYIDRAMTGTNDNRTEFQRMIKDSAKKTWEMVLVYKLDRFSRNKYEMAIHRKTLKDNNVKLVSVKENIPDSPEGVILESMLEGMAEYYSLELAQKVRRGQKESRLKGNYAGGGIPYGYRVETVDGNKKYVIKNEEAAIVKRMFEEYAAGKICRDIIDGLTSDGIYARDGKPFGRTAVYGILHNERYAGVYRHKTDGVFLDTFPSIVSRTLFDTVAAINEENYKGSNSRENPYMLRNRLKCGYCGQKIRGDSGTSRNGTVIKYYTCAGRKKLTNKCRQNPIRKEKIEKLITDITIYVLGEQYNLNTLVDKIFELNEQRARVNETLVILYKEKEENETAIDNVMKAIEKGIVTKTTKQRLEELESRLDEINAKIKIEDAKAEIKLTKPDIVKFINKAIQKEPTQVIKLLVKEAVLFNDRIEVYYNINERRPDGDDTHQAFCFYTCKIADFDILLYI